MTERQLVLGAEFFEGSSQKETSRLLARCAVSLQDSARTGSHARKKGAVAILERGFQDMTHPPYSQDLVP